jgi:hypothetical protein
MKEMKDGDGSMYAQCEKVGEIADVHYGRRMRIVSKRINVQKFDDSHMYSKYMPNEYDLPTNSIPPKT